MGPANAWLSLLARCCQRRGWNEALLAKLLTLASCQLLKLGGPLLPRLQVQPLHVPPCAPAGKVIASTVAENEAMLAELLGTKACAFKPSIPHLVYQYKIFTNFPPMALGEANPEVPDD